MSTEQSLNPELIEQTRQHIRTLVNEIAQFAKSDISPNEFYGEFLPRVVTALAAVGGAVWVLEDQGRLTLAYQVNMQQANLGEKDESDQMRHGRLLQKVLLDGEGTLVAPNSGFGDSEEAGNPTDLLLVLGPLKTELETVGVVEIFQRPNPRLETQRGYLRFLLQMCDLAGEFLKGRQLRHFGDRQVLWSQLEEFTRVVHASLDPRDTAYTIANEGRRIIGCDRVSVAIRRGRRCRVEAISGQDMFDRRSNMVRLMERLATVVVASEEPMWYTGDTTNMAPQVEDALQDYVDETHSKTVAVIPLERPNVADQVEEDPDNPREPEPPVGALIVELIEDSRVPDTVRHRVETVSRHSAAALANAVDHNSLFLLPVWRTLGKARWLVKARTLPITALVSLGILLLLLSMFVVRLELKAQAKGTVEPVLRQDVFAGIDGEVESVYVDHGDRVRGPDPKSGFPGTLLVKLTNTDLSVELSEVAKKLANTMQEIATTNNLLLRSRGTMTEAERAQLHGKLRELETTLLSLQEQQKLLLEKQKELSVYSPNDGVVVTWDVKNLLKERPVRRGDVLMRIADPDGPWQLEVLMPDKRMGHIIRARQAAKREDPDNDLVVEYILASDPDRTLRGKIVEIHQSAEVREEEGNVVLIKVAIDKKDLPAAVRPGATVTAKVHCGKVSLGYWLFHDLIAFIDSKILFSWF